RGLAAKNALTQWNPDDRPNILHQDTLRRRCRVRRQRIGNDVFRISFDRPPYRTPRNRRRILEHLSARPTPAAPAPPPENLPVTIFPKFLSIPRRIALREIVGVSWSTSPPDPRPAA